ncbi:MAG: type II secretion system protein GspN [Pseudomonadota bacterium]|nr:type II secretion system protein GspN [Pseudomonadota bacterium]
MSKTMRYLGYALLFIVSFKIFLVVTFPFNVLKESMLIEFNRSTGLNASAKEMSLSFPLGVELHNVGLRNTAGGQLQFALIDVTVNPLRLLLGQIAANLTIEDEASNPLSLAASVSISQLLNAARSGGSVLPSYLRIAANQYQLGSLANYALQTYTNSPKANQLVAPLLKQVSLTGQFVSDTTLELDSGDLANSKGEIKLNIENLSFAIDSPDLDLEAQQFKTANISAALAEGTLTFAEGSSAFTAQDIAVEVDGAINLKTPINSSSMALEVPVQIKGALQDQFGFLITSLLGGGTDGLIPLKIRGTFARPHVSYR